MKHRTPFPPSAAPAGITHYTLQAKSCANGGKPPLETPTRKGGMLPSSTGAHTAFSCYPALRLYRLSKSQRGIGVVSLTLRYPPFPFRNCLSYNRKLFRQIFLAHLCIFPQTADIFFNHNMTSLCGSQASHRARFLCRRTHLIVLIISIRGLKASNKS